MPFKKGNLEGSKSRKNAERKQQLAAELLGGSVKKAVAAINRALDSDDPGWAAKLVFEYCYGKPPVSVQAVDDKGVPARAVIIVAQ